MVKSGVITVIVFLATGGGLVFPAMAVPTPENLPQIAQFQLSDQPENAVDFVLDAVEEQPATAETFFLKYPNLTEDQKAAIRDIYLQYQLDLKTAIERYLSSINLLNNLVNAATTNEAIAHVREEVMVQERVVYDLLFERTMMIRSTLSTEQRENFNRDLRALFNLGTPMVASTFPEHLIGLPADIVTDQLIAEGWQLSVQTPRILLFDKGDQALDLFINDDFRVEDTTLMTQ